MKKLIRAGATDQTLDLFIQNSSSTTGAGLTGLAYNTASLVCYYRKGATGSATALTLATQTVGGAHSDGGFVEIDATNMPGMYRLDLSDTIVASAGTATLMLKGATNMAPVTIELQVVSFNPEDGVRLGLTALPNAAADAAGGLPISDAGGLDLDAILADTADMQPKLGTPAGASVSADLAAIKSAVDVIDDYVDTEIAAIHAVVVSALTESYAANGAAPTLTQAIMAIHQHLMEFAISGTSYTVKKLDSSTTAFVATLDDATNPTSMTR